jgi:hypothetical protein
MKRTFFFSCLLLSATAFAQETKFEADMRREATDFKQDCGQGGFKAVFGCAKDLFSDWPFHIAVGSIAPQNGFGAGPAFVEHKNTEDWRLSWNADAIGSTNASWRAGLYMQAVYVRAKALTPTTSPTAPIPSSLVRDYPVVHVYAQGISLNQVNYYGIGPSTSRSSEAVFGIRQTIVGANALYPIVPRIRLSLFGELNGRFVDIRNGATSKAPGISDLYTEATAPGLLSQPGFFQAGEGVRFEPILLRDHLELAYALTYQQFVAPGSKYSFQRFTADFGHEFPLYGKSQIKPKAFNGPDECGARPGDHKCPTVMNRTGTVGLRFLLSESMTASGNSVPFYFQPTLGGSDINGTKLLPSYADYRFRAPNIVLFRASFEHSIYGPLGFQFLFDMGKAAATHSDLDFTHMAHSFGAGISLRAGGLPEMSILFAFGGGEGTHTIALMNNSLVGGGMRPSLF